MVSRPADGREAESPSKASTVDTTLAEVSAASALSSSRAPQYRGAFS